MKSALFVEMSEGLVVENKWRPTFREQARELKLKDINEKKTNRSARPKQCTIREDSYALYSIGASTIGKCFQ